MRLSIGLFVCISVLMFTEMASGAIIASPGDDLALQSNGGVGYSSSVGFSGTPDRLNDGNRSGNYFSNSVAHSLTDNPGEYQGVNLSADALLRQVIIWNRTDGGLEGRIDPFRLDIYLDNSVVFTQTVNAFQTNIQLFNGSDRADGMVFNLSPTLADQIRVTTLSDASYLHIAEIEAYAAVVPEPATLAIWGGLGFVGLIAARRRKKLAV